MKLLHIATLAAACGLTLAAGSAAAATDSTTFGVKIVITESCDIHSTTATDVDFLSHPRSTGDHTATGNLVVNCSLNTPYTIALGNGLQPSSATVSDTNRRMISGAGNYVPYGLYRDSGATLLWGSTTGTDTLAGTGTNAAVNVPVYGKVLTASTNVPAGTYTDTVSAVITY